MFKRSILMLASLLLVLAMVIACAPPATPVPVAPPAEPAEPAAPTEAAAAAPARLILATTTSTADSGLLDAILPDFQQQFNAKVDVVAVGTGQALEIGSKGDADVVLVHSRKAEDKFVADGFAKERFDVMYNDFIIVGPSEDPAGVVGMALAKEAFGAIADAGQPFASRGDNSGTHNKEMTIWASIPFTPTAEMGWYNSLGQGMGDTLVFANEAGAYTLTDRGTYLSMRDKLPNLAILVGGENLAENQDKVLLNPYGVLAVNPELHPNVNADLATKFVEWITALETQKLIAEYGVEQFGQPLFYPSSAQWQASQ
ncbi:MAG TPA: substrate-binding domain-containing protein [Anaerolineae bacterium]|nr:substrate-binding domain-containing protein [Anaerolineae bacterium]HNU03188.1 substrate-binding domain-containing protein [Anaerolineae bacterium]